MTTPPRARLERSRRAIGRALRLGFRAPARAAALAGACVALLAAGERSVAAAAAQYHVDIAPLVDGLYLVHSYADYQGQRTESNSLLVASRQCVAMVDTAWSVAQTREVLAWVKATLHQKVKFAVITHAHADRIGGIDALRAANVPTFGDELTPAEARRNGFRSPDHLFRRQLALACGELTLDLFYPGPGHTRDNLAVYVRERKALYGGCFLKSADSTTLGNVADADLRAWPKSLDALEHRFPDAELVIPGHGSTAPGAIAQTRKLLRDAPPQP